MIFEPEWRTDHNLLQFAGIDSVKIPLLPGDQQFAEKIHAYTLPRDGNLNSRTRDLVDMVLLIEKGSLEIERIKKAVAATFKRRGTHSIPVHLSAPPDSWKEPYAALAEDCRVGRKTVEEACTLLENYWKEIVK